MKDYAQVGLAFATSVGAWINFALVVWYARRARLIAVDARLKRSAVRLAGAGLVLAAALLVGDRLIERLLADAPALRAELRLAALACLGCVVYGGALALLFGPEWLAAFRRRRKSSAVPDQREPPRL
jgi:putative peptidoglycan lipid II flippase